VVTSSEVVIFFLFTTYRSVFRDGQLTHSMVYTVWMTLLFTVIGMIVTTFAAYPLARKE
jgi:putative aldouronate transport system permease protein